MKNIFEKPKPPPPIPEKLKALLDTGHVEVFTSGDEPIWVGEIVDMPTNNDLTSKIWTYP